MSTKDRTREKLLNSMRATKKVINEQPDTKQEHAKTYAPKTSASSTVKTPPKTTEAKAKKPARKPTASSQPVSDPYQSRGRVWPD